MLSLPTLDTDGSRQLIRELGRRDEGKTVSALLDQFDLSPESLRTIADQATSRVEASRVRQHYGATVKALWYV